jgi:hypothetical protein
MLSKSVRRPSPALIVAVVALVAALAGSALALPGKNTVQSNDIKKNAVKSKQLKNNGVKGTDVDEASLGQVPSAASANALSFLKHVTPFSLGNGETRVVLTHGPFTLTATCAINSGGQDIARLLISTSVDNATFDAWDETDNFNTATPEADRNFGAEVDVATGTLEVEANVGDGVALAPSGAAIHLIDALTTVNSPALGGPGRCGFNGTFLVL